jgi:hypothetical protein
MKTPIFPSQNESDRKFAHFGPDVDAAAEKVVREGRLSQKMVDMIRSKKVTSKELTAMGKAGGFQIGVPK